MAKRNHLMALPRNQRGQISIFFSASLVVLVSIIAFVINVGLFVKAKINLQNATDAAAFAGAAVQARQLSKIGHLNWEMRNIYKEWMYKYYVIGNLNINDVQGAAIDEQSPMSFRMESDLNAVTQEVTADPYNLPSVCIHLSSSMTNICKRYAIPGLPEFGSSNLPGAEAASRAFQDALISTKVNDCVERTKLNMYVASTWAYNVLSTSGMTFGGQGPAVLSDRQGAWPRAVELAMRIRNLERIVNREAREQGVCISQGSFDKVNCQASIDEVSNESFMGNERLVKAFYTGFRNIGGSFDGDEMKNSFTLTELPPEKFEDPLRSSASNLLIPGNKIYPKQYLDLKLMMVNYAIFYSAMIPRADTQTSGACDVSRAAIPVPGYPLGFYKSPDILTYYAVKGEAEFIGMFNPFGDSVKLTAFAAAKPMGGRIGPMLFTQPQNSEGIFGRTDSVKRRSVPYIASFNIVGVQQKLPKEITPDVFVWEPRPIAEGEFAPGVPLPVNGSTAETRFWLNSPTSAVGGKITDIGGVQFGIPNLVYDYSTPFSNSTYTNLADQIHMMDLANANSDKAIGLFSKDQFARFRGNLGNTVSANQLDQEIARIRAPTSYEAANYLIPVPFEHFSNSNLGHFGQINSMPVNLPNGVKRYRNFIYAPLYGNDPEEILYAGPGEVTTAIFEFMRQQESGILKYRNAMNMAAIEIHRQGDMVSGSADGSVDGYRKAAAGVSDINFQANDVKDNPQTCASLAGTFLHFYWGGAVGAPPGGSVPAPTANAPCPTPLGDLLQTYFAPGGGPDPNFRADHYLMDYSYFPPNFASSPVPGGMGIFSAYIPGPFTGAGQDGTFNNLSSDPIVELMRRNFYSTKLVALESLKANGGYKENNFLIFSEGDVQTTSLEVKQNGFRNPLTTPDDTSSIKH